jgi:transcription initiation factor TFIIE subunit alpha
MLIVRIPGLLTMIPTHAAMTDYDQYYASLAASSTPSGQDTPAPAPFGEFEEEDVKPSVEYLDSLNEYRKRSRSSEDTGYGAPAKTPKLNGHAQLNGFAHPAPEPEPLVVAAEEPLVGETGDDPIVHGALFPRFMRKLLFTVP